MVIIRKPAAERYIVLRAGKWSDIVLLVDTMISFGIFYALLFYIAKSVVTWQFIGLTKNNKN